MWKHVHRERSGDKPDDTAAARIQTGAPIKQSTVHSAGLRCIRVSLSLLRTSRTGRKKTKNKKTKTCAHLFLPALRLKKYSSRLPTISTCLPIPSCTHSVDATKSRRALGRSNKMIELWLSRKIYLIRKKREKKKKKYQAYSFWLIRERHQRLPSPLNFSNHLLATLTFTYHRRARPRPWNNGPSHMAKALGI